MMTAPQGTMTQRQLSRVKAVTAIAGVNSAGLAGFAGSCYHHHIPSLSPTVSLLSRLQLISSHTHTLSPLIYSIISNCSQYVLPPVLPSRLLPHRYPSDILSCPRPPVLRNRNLGIRAHPHLDPQAGRRTEYAPISCSLHSIAMATSMYPVLTITAMEMKQSPSTDPKPSTRSPALSSKNSMMP